MKISYVNKMEDENINKEVFNILKSCDHEFYPPLSSREKSTQMNLKTFFRDVESNPPLKYYENMIKQKFLLAFDEEKLVGFMTFIYDYKSDIYAEKTQDAMNFYITTICVDKMYRKKGICNLLYDALEDLHKNNSIKSYISTRTWSENNSHIAILDKRGYERHKVIEDDRGIGVDTIYFLKEIK